MPAEIEIGVAVKAALQAAVVITAVLLGLIVDATTVVGDEKSLLVLYSKAQFLGPEGEPTKPTEPNPFSVT